VEYGMQYDFVIVGAGIVGLSTAYKLSLSFPDADILVLEKENRVAAHQTGNNSGVIHSGIYYKPNSYRAKNCIDGRHQLVEFCRKNGVAYEICGKVIVAANEDELRRLNKIYETGKINEIEGIKQIDRKELNEIEPYANGIKAIHVPCTGIADFKGVCKTLKERIEESRNKVACGQKVTQIKVENEVHQITTETSKFEGKYLITCGGLQSDLLARLAGIQPAVQIVPFRGESQALTREVEHLVNGLIYPVPEPEFPVLGVHFTKMALGGIECGPNAVFSFKREGYGKLSFSLQDTIETLNYPGFGNLAVQHWRKGLEEYYRSLSKTAFVKVLQKLIPNIRSTQLEPAGSGVRAMALQPNGEIVDDFYFESAPNAIHVLNAPSPAATAGLAIGDEIVKRAESNFNL